MRIISSECKFIIMIFIEFTGVSHDLDAFLKEFDVLFVFVLIMGCCSLFGRFLGLFLRRDFGENCLVSADFLQVGINKFFFGE